MADEQIKSPSEYAKIPAGTRVSYGPIGATLATAKLLQSAMAIGATGKKGTFMKVTRLIDTQPKYMADNQYSPFAVVSGQAFLRDTFIQDGTITTAKIAGVIQSIDYQPAAAGWSINKAGTAEFNNVTVRGAIYATSGNFSLSGTGNTVVINDLGVTVNLPNGGLIRLGRW